MKEDITNALLTEPHTLDSTPSTPLLVLQALVKTHQQVCLVVELSLLCPL